MILRLEAFLGGKERDGNFPLLVNCNRAGLFIGKAPSRALVDVASHVDQAERKDADTICKPFQSLLHPIRATGYACCLKKDA